MKAQKARKEPPSTPVEPVPEVRPAVPDAEDAREDVRIPNIAAAKGASPLDMRNVNVLVETSNLLKFLQVSNIPRRKITAYARQLAAAVRNEDQYAFNVLLFNLSLQGSAHGFKVEKLVEVLRSQHEAQMRAETMRRQGAPEARPEAPR